MPAAVRSVDDLGGNDLARQSALRSSDGDDRDTASYPAGEPGADLPPAFADVAVPLRLRHGRQELAFISTRTTFGTAVDVTVAELSIESFLPGGRRDRRRDASASARGPLTLGVHRARVV
jgi:hypothetical protein